VQRIKRQTMEMHAAMLRLLCSNPNIDQQVHSSVDAQLQFMPTNYGHCFAIGREEAIEDISG